MNTLHSRSLHAVAESPMHALIRTVLQALHLVPKPAAGVTVPEETATAGFLYEQSFVTEREAREFADALASQGCRAQVQQDIYDYCWSVEVFDDKAQGRD